MKKVGAEACCKFVRRKLRGLISKRELEWFAKGEEYRKATSSCCCCGTAAIPRRAMYPTENVRPTFPWRYELQKSFIKSQRSNTDIL